MCEVCGGPHSTYRCCDRCNYDTHICPGCGEPIGHRMTACTECACLLEEA